MLDFQAKSLFEHYQLKRNADLKIQALQAQIELSKKVLKTTIETGILKDMQVGETIVEHGYIFKMKAHYGKHKYLVVEKLEDNSND